MTRERGAAHDALAFSRRLLLVLVAGILVVVGAMTADHVESIGAPVSDGFGTAIDFRDMSDITKASPVTAGEASSSHELTSEDLVLLTCSMVALIMFFIQVFRAGPKLSPMKPRAQERAAHLLPALVVFDNAAPNRLSLCVIRT
jgi:hypothetical protein